MTETVDDVVGVVITRAAVPSGQPRVRTQLHHAEGHCGAGECMAMSGGADEWIDVTREIPLGQHLKRQEQNRKANC